MSHAVCESRFKPVIFNNINKIYNGMGRIKSVKNFINLLYINFCNILSILKNIELRVNEIYELSSSIKDAQIKGTKQLEDVNESIKFINEKFEE